MLAMQVRQLAFYEFSDRSLSVCQTRNVPFERPELNVNLPLSQGQPGDHPFPLACEELRYLKFHLYQLDTAS